MLLTLALSFLLLPSSGSSALAPTIASDKADYAPGETVTLAGANWQPGESVHIVVNDDAGQTWTHSVDVTAVADGTIADQFVLPDWFVATYSVTATGAVSGTATTTFTDSVISVSITSPTTASPLTITSLPANVTVAFNYSTSPAGTTTGEARVLSATTGFTATKTLTSGANKSDSIVVPIAAGTANGSYNVQVKVTNAAGSGATQKVDTQPDAVVIRVNAPPTVGEISGSASVAEGTPGDYSVSATDPDGDTLTYAWSITSGSASIVGAANGSTASIKFTDGPSTVGLQVVVDDQHGHTVTRTKTVTVNNVAPTVTLTGPDSVDESTTAARTFNYAASDPAGANDPLTLSFNCGANGSVVANSDTGSSFQCIFPDGGPTANPTVSTVSVSANDGDGGIGSASTQVTVRNVAPTVAVTGPDVVYESTSDGRTFNYEAHDPAGANDPLTISSSCGAKGTVVPNSDNGSSFQCMFPDGAVTPVTLSTVSVSADDGDGGVGSASKEVTVRNVAPTVALTSGDTSIPEGSSSTANHTYTFGITDPGADAITAFTAGCGPQGTKISQSFTGRTGSVTCTFSSTLLADGPNSTTITASATDDDGATGPTLTVVITITNVAPAVTPKIPATLSTSKVFFTVNAAASFVDPGKKDAPWSGRIEWGDGSATDPTGISASNGSGTISATHAYRTPGTYVITYKVKDKEGDVGMATVTIVITN